MKRIITLCLICFITFPVGAQNAYHDVIALSQLNPFLDTPEQKVYFPAIHQEEAAEILQNYTTEKMTYGQLFNAYQQNPFIGLPLNAEMSTSDIAAADRGVLSSIGGLNVTNFAVGLSDFLIDRAKRELNIAFFARFERWLEKNEEARILFPTTASFLANISVHQYSNLLDALRTAFYRDLQELPTNFLNLTEADRIRTLLQKEPEALAFFEALSVLHQFHHSRTHPSELFDQLQSLPALRSDTLKEELHNFKNLWRLMSVFSDAVRADSTRFGRAWIPLGQFRENILNDELNFKIFTGLLYQSFKMKNVTFRQEKDTVATHSFIKNNTTDLFRLKNDVIRFLGLAEKFQTAFSEIKNANGEIPSEKVHQYISTALDIVDFSFHLVRYVEDEELKQERRFVSMAGNLNQIVLNSELKQYNAAILNATDFLNEFRLLLISGQKRSEGRKLVKLIDAVRQYGLFMANVAGAESAREVEAAIEAAALPVGSSSMKKYSRMDVAIQAYIGGQFNLSRAVDEEFDENTSWTQYSSIFAPVGISITPGFLSWGRGGSVSLFGSFLDVGAVVQSRLEHPRTDPDVIEEIKLGYVLSPGVYMQYGFPFNWPLSLGIGGQYGPGLTEIIDNGTVVVDPAWRYNISLTVDIPVFTVHNRAKRTYKFKE